MAKGLMLTTPGGNRFWHPCADAAAGLKEMTASQEQAKTYGAAWGHPHSQLEYGDSDGVTFVPSEVLKASERPKTAAGDAAALVAGIWRTDPPQETAPPPHVAKPPQDGAA